MQHSQSRQLLVWRKLSPEDYAKVDPSEPWIPNHFTSTMNLMEAVKQSGFKTHVVNGAYARAHDNLHSVGIKLSSVAKSFTILIMYVPRTTECH